jgi:hypothetical protein
VEIWRKIIVLNKKLQDENEELKDSKSQLNSQNEELQDLKQKAEIWETIEKKNGWRHYFFIRTT